MRFVQVGDMGRAVAIGTIREISTHQDKTKQDDWVLQATLDDGEEVEIPGYESLEDFIAATDDTCQAQSGYWLAGVKPLPPRPGDDSLYPRLALEFYPVASWRLSGPTAMPICFGKQPDDFPFDHAAIVRPDGKVQVYGWEYFRGQPVTLTSWLTKLGIDLEKQARIGAKK
jgi:hypothetical protein